LTAVEEATPVSGDATPTSAGSCVYLRDYSASEVESPEPFYYDEKTGAVIFEFSGMSPDECTVAYNCTSISSDFDDHEMECNAFVDMKDNSH